MEIKEFTLFGTETGLQKVNHIQQDQKMLNKFQKVTPVIVVKFNWFWSGF